MERAEFMTCNAASHQGGDLRARGFTFKDEWDTPAQMTINNLTVYN